MVKKHYYDVRPNYVLRWKNELVIENISTHRVWAAIYDLSPGHLSNSMRYLDALRALAALVVVQLDADRVVLALAALIRLNQIDHNVGRHLLWHRGDSECLG
jgi:hypothetical protein